jgi:hypothetical protein
MLSLVISDGFLSTFWVLSGLPRVFPRRIPKPGDEKFHLTCLGVSVILDTVHLVFRLIVSSADCHE